MTAVHANTARSRSGERSFVWQTHPLYDEWYETWRLAGEVYEGDGGFLDGSNLVPHPRELNYRQTKDGLTLWDQVAGEKPKFKRRKQVARYENFAQALMDIFVDHQYAKTVSRGFETQSNTKRPIEDWWENVDGQGTQIDDWLKQHQSLANTYGHLNVLMDREYQEREPRSRAEQAMPQLCVYTPEDTLDWLAPRKRLTAMKFVEAVERSSLSEPASFADARTDSDVSTKDLPNVRFFFWDEQGFTVYNRHGKRERWGSHKYGELPVTQFYSRRRVRIPMIGRPIMRDPKVFKDHYNLVSELRALMRDQVFSMLNIQLGPEEEVATARGMLGDHAGTDTILWTRGTAQFISPADGPAARYAQEIQDVERKMFRLMGLPWENDSADAESADSRKLKASDLNRVLAGYADEAERFEYDIARKFYIAYYGRDVGLRRLKEDKLRIKHPDEFNVAQLLQVVEETQAALGIRLGETAERQIKKNAVSVLVPNITPSMKAAIEKEIDEMPTEGEQEAEYQRLLAEATRPPEPELEPVIA